jgi:hypothetical protein
MPGPASLHGKTFLASLVLVLFAGSMIVRLQEDAGGESSQTLTVEHGASFGLGIAIGENETLKLLEIANQGEETIHITVPEDWRRTEVRNVPLASVAPSAPGLGYVRWTLPASASVSFRSPKTWGDLTVQNASKIPFKILLTKVELETGRTEKDVILVKDATHIMVTTHK